MSVIVDYLIFAPITEERGEAIEQVNAALDRLDEQRHQQFREIDTSHAGGVKFFTNTLWAGAFNHLVPNVIDEAIAGASWRHPDETLVIAESADYDYPAQCRTVTEIREGVRLRTPDVPAPSTSKEGE